MQLELLSGNWRPFCLGLNMLNHNLETVRSTTDTYLWYITLTAKSDFVWSSPYKFQMGTTRRHTASLAIRHMEMYYANQANFYNETRERRANMLNAPFHAVFHTSYNHFSLQISWYHWYHRLAASHFCLHIHARYSTIWIFRPRPIRSTGFDHVTSQSYAILNSVALETRS